jgi:hypothetical protein
VFQWRRPSAVVNLNCVTNRVAPGSRYKLSYGAEQYKKIHTLLNILHLQPPHPTVRHSGCCSSRSICKASYRDTFTMTRRFLCRPLEFRSGNRLNRCDSQRPHKRAVSHRPRRVRTPSPPNILNASSPLMHTLQTQTRQTSSLDDQNMISALPYVLLLR